MNLKELREKFIERDSNSIDKLRYQDSYGMGVTEYLELRLQFTEGRLKDLCEVTMALIQELEERDSASTTRSS